MQLVRVREEATEPDPACARRYDELHSIYATLYASQRDAMRRLGAPALAST